ncbi:hypothetical protein BGZ63DRAFT_420783 [Mariannaea sp. PMI_226]|nr:hypothetical protein BGZ63DRAFT_420783 [Mariannaea sp. PMI_226]
MCIRINSWFICPVETPPPGEELPRTESPPNVQYPHYERDTVVDEITRRTHNIPQIDGFTYVHHQEQTWIRCAVAAASPCFRLPHQIRTEHYAVPCPTCTRDDICLLPSAPYRVDYVDDIHLIDVPDDDIGTINNYFYELLVIMETFVDVELGDGNLSIHSHALHYANMCCTQNPHHIGWDEPDRPPTSWCNETECPNSRKPWCHNVSRASRIRDSQLLRSGRAHNWWARAEDPEGFDLPTFIQLFFGPVPNQRWYALAQEGESVRFNRLVSQIGANIQKLVALGPTVQGWVGEVPDLETWKLILSKREALALLFVWYAAHDPGVSSVFLNILMERYILSTLNPFFEQENAPPGWRYLDCRTPAPGRLQQLTERFVRLLFVGNNGYKVERAEERVHDTMRILKYNRDTDYQNRGLLLRAIDGATLANLLTDLEAIQALPDCAICGDRFFAQEVVPYHLNVTLTSCCKQPLHFRCFKAIITSTGLCPFCRHQFDRRLFEGDDMFMSMENRPGADLTGGSLFGMPLPDHVRRLQDILRQQQEELRQAELDGEEGEEEENWDEDNPDVDHDIIHFVPPEDEQPGDQVVPDAQIVEMDLDPDDPAAAVGSGSDNNRSYGNSSESSAEIIINSIHSSSGGSGDGAGQNGDNGGVIQVLGHGSPEGDDGASTDGDENAPVESEEEADDGDNDDAFDDTVTEDDDEVVQHDSHGRDSDYYPESSDDEDDY